MGLSTLGVRRQREQRLWQNRDGVGILEHFPTGVSARAPLSLVFFSVFVSDWVLILVLSICFYPPSLLMYFVCISPAIQPCCWTGLRPLFPLCPDTTHGDLLHQDLHFKLILPMGPPPPGPAFQTHFFPEMNSFYLQIPTLSLFLTPKPWLPDLWPFFILFCLRCSTSLFFCSQVRTSFLETKTSHSMQLHTWSYKHSCPKTSPFLPALPPNLHNLIFSCQGQDLDHYFTVHCLISIFSSNFFFCLFTFLALCLCPFPMLICQMPSFLQSVA